jgi:hypothetical protein
MRHAEFPLKTRRASKHSKKSLASSVRLAFPVITAAWENSMRLSIIAADGRRLPRRRREIVVLSAPTAAATSPSPMPAFRIHSSNLIMMVYVTQANGGCQIKFVPYRPST